MSRARWTFADLTPRQPSSSSFCFFIHHHHHHHHRHDGSGGWLGQSSRSTVFAAVFFATIITFVVTTPPPASHLSSLQMGAADTFALAVALVAAQGSYRQSTCRVWGAGTHIATVCIGTQPAPREPCCSCAEYACDFFYHHAHTCQSKRSIQLSSLWHYTTALIRAHYGIILRNNKTDITILETCMRLRTLLFFSTAGQCT